MAASIETQARLELEAKVAYLTSRLNDLSARVVHDDTKFEALNARVNQIEVAVALLIADLSPGPGRKPITPDDHMEY